MKHRTFLKLALAGALAGSSLLAQAQKPALSIVVGFAPGGTSDGVARLLAQKLPELLGRPVVVENKAGALGGLAIKEAIAGTAERPAFAVLPFSSVVFPVLTQPSLRYDIFKDLQSVASLTAFPLGVVVGAGTGVRTPKDLIAWLREHPKQAQFGTAGAGGHNHFLGLQLGKASGVESTVVPYKGNAPLLNDLLPGHVPAGIMVAGEVLPHIKEGKLRLLGVLTPQRSPLMPDVPTFAEQGVAVDSGEAWYGMWTGAATPREDVLRMQDALQKVLAMPDVKEALTGKYAMTPDYRSAEQTARRLRADFDHWAPIIKASGFKGE